jgi:predicted RNase H-like nuclease
VADDLRSVWGLDIGKGQWACVKLILGADDRILEVRSEALAFRPAPILTDDCIVAVADVPIGLIADSEAVDTAKGGRSGARVVDKGARKWVLHNGSVASPPTIEQFESGLVEHARAESAATEAERRRKLSNVVPAGLTQMGLEMIPAIESAAETKARHPNKLYESHPEVVFAVMAGGIIPVSKKTLAGTLGRAHYLSQRLSFDCLKWVMTQEGRFGIEVDDWLDSLSMALVAHDWRLPAQRRMLATADGKVQHWSTESDRLMAIPCTEVAELPTRLSFDKFIELFTETKGCGA